MTLKVNGNFVWDNVHFLHVRVMFLEGACAMSCILKKGERIEISYHLFGPYR